ncbi:uncharacterized protein E5676_scaffold522G00590 [Cucumis melo var. makuwa]|uniref:Retrotransposon gag domain-containing protein n=1 Tax=Cucumis melo var. makuwa TaxID=1194695 RepID=A0A5D3D6G9_CUCMM|nr:uncharacterized protein E5676_scaffold522G00590 [Cucumis melo var. makuwa]
MLEDFRATRDVVKNEIADVNTRLNLTMQAMAYQVPVEGAVRVTKYFKATNTVTEEVKVTLATMYLCEDAKLWWRSRYMDIQEGRYTIDIWGVLKKELCSQFFLENVEILARRKLCDLKHTGNIREGRGQTSKTPLGEGFRKNEGREFRCPTCCRTSETNGQPMPSAKCLVITRSFPTIVQADIHQPNGFKMISVMQLDRSPAQEEPPSIVILLGALGKLRETVPKDTLCVPEKCHGVMPNSWPKLLSM